MNITKEQLFKRFKLLTAALLMTLSSLAPVVVAGEARASAVPVGVYNGPGAVTALNNFSSWLGTPVTYATDYVDYKNGWSTDFNPTWLIGPWGKWVSASPGTRRLVLGLPMLENSNTGQFDQGAAGAFDGYFQSLAQQMVSSGLAYSIIRLGYEANCNTIGPWQATDNPAGYVAEFRHLVQVLRAVPGSHFTIDWTVCNGWQAGHALDSFASFYPGDDVVDIMGIDVYDVKWNDPTVTAQQRWDYNVTRYMGMADQRNFAAAHGKPISIPEWGLYKAGDIYAGGGDNPYFIDQMAGWIQSNNTYYQSYFNLDWGGGVLANFPNGQAEYKLLFGGQSSTPTPPPAPLDTQAPVVTINSPSNGAVVNSKFKVNAAGSDNTAVTKMEIYLDGALKNSTANSTLSYMLTTKIKGSHTVLVKAYDSAGNIGQASITVTVS